MQLKDKLDIPVFNKVYGFYKMLHDFQNIIPKAKRYTLWQKCENTALDILEILHFVTYLPKNHRAEQLIIINSKVDMLKMFIRLSYETKTIDLDKTVQLQEHLDEIGRMIGGWLKASSPNT